MITVPIHRAPDVLAEMAATFPGGFTEVGAVYVGLDSERRAQFTHARIPDKILSLRSPEPRVTGAREGDNWHRLLREAGEQISSTLRRTCFKFAVVPSRPIAEETTDWGFLVFSSLDEAELGFASTQLTFLPRRLFELNQDLLAFLPPATQEAHRGRSTTDLVESLIDQTERHGSELSLISVDNRSVVYKYLAAPQYAIDVELFSTARKYVPIGAYWEKALEGNVVGPDGNVIGIDHTHPESTQEELDKNPFLAEIARRSINPRHELMISPGDAADFMIHLKGDLRLRTRGGQVFQNRERTIENRKRYSNVSLASMGVTMVGTTPLPSPSPTSPDNGSSRMRTGHATFDYDALIKDQKRDEFIRTATESFRDPTINSVMRFLDLIRPYTRLDDNLPYYLRLLRS